MSENKNASSDMNRGNDEEEEGLQQEEEMETKEESDAKIGTAPAASTVAASTVANNGNDESETSEASTVPSGAGASFSSVSSGGARQSRAERRRRKRLQLASETSPAPPPTPGATAEPSNPSTSTTTTKSKNVANSVNSTTTNATNNNSTNPLLHTMSNSNLMSSLNQEVDELADRSSQQFTTSFDRASTTTTRPGSQVTTATCNSSSRSLAKSVGSTNGSVVTASSSRSRNHSRGGDGEEEDRPGAYAQPGRAFGERPAWSRPPQRGGRRDRSSRSLSITAYSLRSWLSSSRRTSLTSNITTPPEESSASSSYHPDVVAQASMVTDVEAVVYATDVSKDVEKQRREHRYFVMFGICGIVALVLSAIGLGVGLSLSSSNNDNNNDEPAETLVLECDVPDERPLLYKACECNLSTIPELPNHTVRYRETLVDLLVEDGVLPEEFGTIHNATSCDSRNLALHVLLAGLEHPSNDDNLDMLDDNDLEQSDTDDDYGGQNRYWLIDAVASDSMRTPVNLLSQRYALTVLYMELEGDSWDDNMGWVKMHSPCRWFGVHCTISGRVTELNLPANNLQGTIPSEIGALSFLSKLFLVG